MRTYQAPAREGENRAVGKSARAQQRQFAELGFVAHDVWVSSRDGVRGPALKSLIVRLVSPVTWREEGVRELGLSESFGVAILGNGACERLVMVGSRKIRSATRLERTRV